MNRQLPRQAALPWREPGQAEDPRVDAFRRWISGADRLDLKASQASARELRDLGVSVCVATRPRGGAR